MDRKIFRITLCKAEYRAHNSEFKMASLTHAQRVTRLYRRSMKHLLSWCVEREIWRKEALKLRAEFDHYKYETDRNKITTLLEEGEERYRRQSHPDPYISKYLLMYSRKVLSKNCLALNFLLVLCIILMTLA